MGFAKDDAPNHLTDVVSDALTDTEDTRSSHGTEMPGPSPNPATNLIIHDIVLRSVGRLSRMTVEKAVLGKQYGNSFAKDAVENRSVVHALAAYGVTKFAKKSVPGAAVVGAGLLVKVLFDRSQSRRKARQNGRQALRKQADPDSLR